MKAAILAFLASPLVVSAAQAPSAPLFVDIPQIMQVKCAEGSGTAFRIKHRGIVSVNHVTSMTGCTINGEPLQVTYADPKIDFASGRASQSMEGLEIDCGGYKDGQVYVGVGYAEGLPFQRAIVVAASDKLTKIASWKDFYVLFGDERFIPGQSGGPVLTREGKVVGLVNGLNLNFPLSYSRPLSETPLCAGRVG